MVSNTHFKFPKYVQQGKRVSLTNDHCWCRAGFFHQAHPYPTPRLLLPLRLSPQHWSEDCTEEDSDNDDIQFHYIENDKGERVELGRGSFCVVYAGRNDNKVGPSPLTCPLSYRFV